MPAGFVPSAGTSSGGRGRGGRVPAVRSRQRRRARLAGGITFVILPVVKTAISIPDEIFELATRRAKKLGISRSELVTRALRHYLADQRAREIQASYDRAFGTGDDDTAELRREAARKGLADVEW